MKQLSILVIILILMSLSSCEVINTFLNPSSGTCLLVNTSMNVPNDPAHVETSYTYNSTDQLIEVNKASYDLDPHPYVDRWEMSYSGNKLNEIKYFTKFLSDPEEQHTTHTFYFVGDLVDSIDIVGSLTYGPIKGYIKTSYQNNKLDSVWTYHKNAMGNQYEWYSTTVLTWTGDNVTKVNNEYKTQTGSITYEYDDQNAPMNHFGLAFSRFGSYAMLSKNNVIKITQIIWDGSSYVTDYTISYTANGYPSEIAQKDIPPTTYEYSCN